MCAKRGITQDAHQRSQGDVGIVVLHIRSERQSDTKKGLQNDTANSHKCAHTVACASLTHLVRGSYARELVLRLVVGGLLRASRDLVVVLSALQAKLIDFVLQT